MNWIGVRAIYLHEMDRMKRTTIQSIFSPVISAALYFVVFGAAIGSRIPIIEDVDETIYELEENSQENRSFL